MERYVRYIVLSNGHKRNETVGNLGKDLGYSRRGGKKHRYGHFSSGGKLG